MDKNELTRIEAFSDAVFAIAATLLVLDLRVPLINHNLSLSDLWIKMSELWPSYLAFLLSFGTILIIWVNHHYTVRLLHKISKSFLYANGFLLLTITVFPFPTAVLSEYINTKFATAAVTIYSLACLLINVAFIIWWSSMRKPVYLIKPEVSTVQIKKILTQLWIGVVIYIFATIVSFWFPIPGIIIIIVTNILWITMSILDKNAQVT
jgi:uncharacterized membrane protein